MHNDLIVRKSCLKGIVKVSGAKNSVLKLMTASLLTENEVTLHNYPSSILDAQIHVGMLEKLGKSCLLSANNTVIISEDFFPPSELIWDERSIRNTLLILGALTARTGAGAVPFPGGCQLGDRSFDLHEMILRTMGASVWQDGDMLCAETSKNGLLGKDIHLPIRSTGATENAIMMGTLARGITRVWNPHIRPEILDLIKFLRKMGAKIHVYGQEHIEIEGVDSLTGTTHTVIPDSIEAMTWLVGAVITGGDVEILHFPYSDLEVAIVHIRESGANFYRGEDSLIVRGGTCYPLEISTGPHPGINSDAQPILAAYASQAMGESRIIDLRFPGRYGYAKEMGKMGLRYSLEGNILRIFGEGGKLKGAEVEALNLRAGAALALCALTAEGETVIRNAWQIERGYNDFRMKLSNLTSGSL